MNRMWVNLNKIAAPSWLKVGAIALGISIVLPVQAQLQIPPLLQTPNLLNQNGNTSTATGNVRLDGRRLFKIAYPKSELPQRIADIERKLNDISRIYFNNDIAELEVSKRVPPEFQNSDKPSEQIPKNIHVSVGDQEVRLLSVTAVDANVDGVSIDTKADQMVENLKEGLEQAKQERQAEFLVRQGIIAGCTAISLVLVSLSISRYGRRSKQQKQKLAVHPSGVQPLFTQLNREKQRNVKEMQHRLFQLIQGALWIGGSVFILGLFPYTRPLQVIYITILRIPIRIGLVSTVTYFLIRASYALINRFTAALASDYLVAPDANRRVRLRMSTISGVTKSIVTISWCGIGILVALSLIGVDIGPILAGAGIVGVAVSLGSQNLIKDALNGFFIILEDQYAIGDVITVGDVGGLVEDMNLRITQLRDAEGRLITIPNSEIKIVANLSSNWSRADLNIPVGYQADVDRALKIINEVAEQLSSDADWQETILEPPSVLGVENFDNRGLVIRVWIKTQPLKQWDVSREFRRRIKIAFEKAGMSIPLPQQQLWFDHSSAQLASQHNNHS
ncbi:MAG: mechanosensitive ion channel family protein [Cyanophyceae cyanobacterium]